MRKSKKLPVRSEKKRTGAGNTKHLILAAMLSLIGAGSLNAAQASDFGGGAL